MQALKSRNQEWVLSTLLQSMSFIFRVCLIVVCIGFPAGSAQGAPVRIVSLAPSVTEWIDALGLTGSLVGVTEQCDFPPAVSLIEKVGPFMRTNVESVLMKKPTDVVAVNGIPGSLSVKFKSQGIRVHIFSVRRLADIPLEIEKLGTALGAPAKAKEWSEKMASAFAVSNRAQQPRKDVRKFLLVVSMQPLFVASEKSWMSDLFELSGMQNAMRDLGRAAQTDSEFVRISQEIALKVDAERWVMFSDKMMHESQIRSQAQQFLLKKRGQNLDALKIYPADILTRPGPRLIDALRLIEEKNR